MDATINGGGYSPYTSGSSGANKASKADQTGTDATKSGSAAKSQEKGDGFGLGDLVQLASTVLNGFDGLNATNSIVAPSSTTPSGQAQDVLGKLMAGSGDVKDLLTAVRERNLGDAVSAFSKLAASFPGLNTDSIITHLKSGDVPKATAATLTAMANNGATAESAAALKQMATSVETRDADTAYKGAKELVQVAKGAGDTGDVAATQKGGKPVGVSGWRSTLGGLADLASDVTGTAGKNPISQVLDGVASVLNNPEVTGLSSALGEGAEALIKGILPGDKGDGLAETIGNGIEKLFGWVGDKLGIGGGDDEETQEVAAQTVADGGGGATTTTEAGAGTTQTTGTGTRPDSTYTGDPNDDPGMSQTTEGANEGFESSEYKTPTSYNPDDTAVGGKDYKEVPAVKSEQAQQIDDKMKDEQSVYDSAKSEQAQQIDDKMKDEESVYDSAKSEQAQQIDDKMKDEQSTYDSAKSEQAQQIDDKMKDEESVYDSANAGFESSEYKTPSVDTGDGEAQVGSGSETAKTNGAIGGESTSDHSLFDGSKNTPAATDTSRTEAADKSDLGDSHGKDSGDSGSDGTAIDKT